jgi:hypothetical protein
VVEVSQVAWPGGSHPGGSTTDQLAERVQWPIPSRFTAGSCSPTSRLQARPLLRIESGASFKGTSFSGAKRQRVDARKSSTTEQDGAHHYPLRPTK